MITNSLIFVDKISLATGIAQALYDNAIAGPNQPVPGAVLEFALSIFPFTGRFDIIKDGSAGLRWKCIDSEEYFAAVVFSRPVLARQQIRDWILECIGQMDAAIAQARVTVANLREEQKGLRARQSQIRESLVTNVDVARQVELKAEDASIRVEIARLRLVIAEYQTAIRHLKELIPTLDDPFQAVAAQEDVLGLQTGMAEENEKVKQAEVTLAEIAEQMQETISPTERQTLEAELASVEVSIRALETRIAELQGEMASQIKVFVRDLTDPKMHFPKFERHVNAWLADMEREGGKLIDVIARIDTSTNPQFRLVTITIIIIYADEKGTE